MRLHLPWIIALGLYAIATAACAHDDAEGKGAVVNAPAGIMRGVDLGDIHVFKGVPYAAAPVGDLRWRPPNPAPEWDGELDATKFGPACMQHRTNPTSIYAEDLPAMSEDCLMLNIWQPKNAKKAPVFVWIHGGALAGGASHLSMYDGAALAESGLVVVSINYRLGVIGWLAHPELSAESPDDVSGNYGLLDQIAALEWIQQNIEAFGGDADNVTIAGESAGALSAMYLMTSPRARGLFHKVIAQSAYMISTPALKEPRYGVPSAESIGVYVANALNAKDISAMRALDADALTKNAIKAGYIAWGTVDGVLMPDEIVNVFDRGEQAPVPIIAGFNSGEIRSLRALLPKAPKNADAYEAAIKEGYGDLADDFFAQYPSEQLSESMLATTRDAMYGWTSERLARKQSEIGENGFLYIFNHGYPAANDAGLHAFHASEIPYVFGTIYKVAPNWPEIPNTPTEKRLSDAMLAYWSSFARDGAPSAPGEPAWRPYSRDESYMYFEAGPEGSATNLLPGMYELHEEVICRRRAANVAWNWNVGVAAPPLPPQTPECR